MSFFRKRLQEALGDPEFAAAYEEADAEVRASVVLTRSTLSVKITPAEIAVTQLVGTESLMDTDSSSSSFTTAWPTSWQDSRIGATA